MSYHDIRYEVEDPCAVITLDRPEQLNAFTYRTLAEIRDAVTRAGQDSRVVGIIFTGSGRAFSAGLDMSVLEETTANAGKADENAATSVQSLASQESDALPGIFSYLLEVPKPVISAVNGVAAGGGLILALMSDLRFAAPGAALTTVFLKRGLISEHGSSWLLPRMVGVSRALDLLWMSDKISAEEALQIGLIDRVEPDVMSAAREYIIRLSQTAAPRAIAASKRLVYRHLGCGYEEALHEANAVQDEFVAAPDAAEGARSFIEKRPPNFSRVGE